MVQLSWLVSSLFNSHLYSHSLKLPVGLCNTWSQLAIFNQLFKKKKVSHGILWFCFFSKLLPCFKSALTDCFEILWPQLSICALWCGIRMWGSLRNADLCSHLLLNPPGLSFQDFYQQCREAFLVNSDLTLRAQLTEFRDHKLIRTKKVRLAVTALYSRNSSACLPQDKGASDWDLIVELRFHGGQGSI